MDNISNPIRVLHVLGALNIGGAETMVMNLYRNIDRDKVQFDFVIHTTAHCDFTDEILELGGRIYSCPRYVGKNHFQYCKWWNNFLKEHEEFHIIHGHVRSTASLYLAVAKKLGRVTIAHSHSMSNGEGSIAKIKNLMQFPIRYIADYYFGCSMESGQWLFGNKVVNSERYKIIKNAIDIENFAFNSDVRESIRDYLGVKENNQVYGHVGRFHEAKNYPFLLDLFAIIYKNNRDARLVLVGDGEIRDLITKQIKNLGIEDGVILLGLRNDIAELMQAMDIFLFPSLWEGLPVTVIEAQASGLPCFISNTITKEVNVSELVKVLPIDKGVESWINEINDSDLLRKDVSSQVIEAGFDIKESSKWMQRFYREIGSN